MVAGLTNHFEALKTSIKHSSEWIPLIPLLSTHFLENVDGQISPAYDMGLETTVNLSQVLFESSTASCLLQSHRSYQLKYPKTAIFQIEGFDGVQNHEEVINHLQKVASAHGTSLTVRSSRQDKSKT